MTPGLLDHLGIFGNLAAGDRAQACHDVAADAAAPHHDAEALSFDVHGAMSGNILRRGYQHDHSPR
jgi:hypothetical protein